MNYLIKTNYQEFRSKMLQPFWLLLYIVERIKPPRSPAGDSPTCSEGRRCFTRALARPGTL